MSNSSPLLIVGASTRAAAASAVRAGFAPICVDRFGDEDLRDIAEVLAVRHLLRDSLSAIQSLPPTPWIYTGSLENDLEFIEAISERHPLLGNASDVLAMVRNPFWLERTLRAAGIPTLKNYPVDCPPKPDGRFLLKPRHSAGGHSISIWEGQSSPVDSSFFQEWCCGQPMSALFLASQQETDLVGICQQLIGAAFDSPWEFGYAGSIGSVSVSKQLRQSIVQIGTLIARHSGLRGLFGCDFILSADDEIPWLLEINPRYTASVEILERATGRPLLAEHALACGHRFAVVPRSITASTNNVFGKQIVFAKTDMTASDLAMSLDHEGHSVEKPLIADIPAKQSRIAAGWPICTVFAESPDVSSCQAELVRRAQAVLFSMTRP